MADAAEPVKQPRRRQRPGLSCLECRRRKVKCNQARPCDQCTKGRRPGCSYGPRNNDAVVSTLPWASGKPESFGPSGEALREARSSIVGSLPNQDLGNSVESSNLDVQSIALQPRAPNFPTPATSPEGRGTGSEVASASGIASAAETPGSGKHPSTWIGSDKRDQSALNSGQLREHTTEHNNTVFHTQPSSSFGIIRSKLDGASKISAIGRSPFRKHFFSLYLLFNFVHISVPCKHSLSRFSLCNF